MAEAVMVQRNVRLPVAFFCYLPESNKIVFDIRDELRMLVANNSSDAILDTVTLSANQAIGLNGDGILFVLLEQLVTVEQLLSLQSGNLAALQHCLRQLLDCWDPKLARFADFLQRCGHLRDFGDGQLSGLIQLAGAGRAVALARRLEAPLGDIFNRPESLIKMYFKRLQIRELRNVVDNIALLQGVNFQAILGMDVDDLLTRMLKSGESARSHLKGWIRNSLLELAAVVLFQLLEDLDAHDQPNNAVLTPAELESARVVERRSLIRSLIESRRSRLAALPAGVLTLSNSLLLLVSSNGNCIDPKIDKLIRCENSAGVQWIPYSIEFENWTAKENNQLAKASDDYINLVLPQQQQQRSIFLFVLDEPLFSVLKKPASHARSLLLHCLSTGRPLLFVYRDCDTIFNGLLDLGNSLQADLFRRPDVDSFRFPARCPPLRPTTLIGWLSFIVRYGFNWNGGNSKADLVTMQNLLRYLHYFDQH